MKIGIIASVLVALLLSACATLPQLTESDLPEGSTLVAGGLALEWTAPSSGTAIFLEASSGKILKSKSLEPGDHFSFNLRTPEDVDLLNRVFSRKTDLSAHSLLPLPKNSLFLLYFTPSDSDIAPHVSQLRASN